MAEQSYTEDGLERVKEKLEALKQKRKEITKRIEEAIKLGDLSENAEYHEAKDDQGMNEAKIRELESIIKSAKIVKGGTKSQIDVGASIEVKVNGNNQEFTIVGSAEANPMEGLISNESPLGQAFMGKRKGDTVEVDVPAGKIKYKIVSVK